MNCEEFELVGLEHGSEDGPLPKAALEHVSQCSRCAALQESWQAARAELRAMASETKESQAPARVEMRLLQEFRTKHRSVLARRAAILAAWGLAAAVLLMGMVSAWNWRQMKQDEVAKLEVTPQSTSAQLENSGAAVQGNEISGQTEEVLMAGNEGGDFTMLPGSVPVAADENAIVRVRMQRGSLSALGLPVNEERAGEWIQVDLLLGADGQPEAVRLLQTNTQITN
jgi:hypothetical protein